MQTLQDRIRHTLEQKNAILLAHYYQRKEIQEIAHFLGDSLELARKAQQTKHDIIVFAGVKFMAETAKILNPDRKVLLPSLEAGCSLADSCPPDEFAKFKEQNPDHLVVSYVNTSSEIKAMSDYICTSSNAQKVIESIPNTRPIIFAPDKNLGHYLNKVTNRNMLLWDGVCTVHEAFSMEKMTNLKLANMDAKIIAHPESDPVVLDIADFIGSTSALLNYVINDSSEKYIIATEVGILNKMRLMAPNKKFIPAPINENNTCACSECAFMKTITLENLYTSIVEEKHEIIVEPELARKALIPLQNMINMN
ncbi:MAG: quinolinate synthase [Ignavibacteriae bacterium HGW-Ignavibacteriae-4]|jgi:quinolinate synthase|nr:MAG: quinolinate synthase [Ignavibacteriae bacterium HGW-Ignavibacteriae-4]